MNKINVGIIGAGNFAGKVLIPIIQENDKYDIKAIANESVESATKIRDICKLREGTYSTNNYRLLLKDESIDMILIATRHDKHAEMTIEAMKHDKKIIFCEKPACLTREELKEISKLVEEKGYNGKDKIFTAGYNRRYSPYITKVKVMLTGRKGPMTIIYEMYVRKLGKDHWTNTTEGGGRNIGEACHIYDIFNYLIKSDVVEIKAFPINGKELLTNSNFQVCIKYHDGSIATLLYTELASDIMPKERMTIAWDNQSMIMIDYKGMSYMGKGSKYDNMTTPLQNKGHKKQFENIANNKDIVGWEDVLSATYISLQVEVQIKYRGVKG